MENKIKLRPISRCIIFILFSLLADISNHFGIILQDKSLSININSSNEFFYIRIKKCF